MSPDGHTLVCAVCYCFLTEQWNSFERNRTPIEKRMYWLKRPYQCDSRRVPQEWNLSYDLERRLGAGRQSYDGGAESDFSSFSDNENLSDQEMDVVNRSVTGKDKCPRVSGKSPRDSNRKNNVIAVKNSPDSQRGVRYPVGVYGSPKTEGALPLRRGAKIMNNACQSSESLKPQERFPLPGYGSPVSDAPVQDNEVIMRNRPWLEEGTDRHAEPRQVVRASDGSCAPSRGSQSRAKAELQPGAALPSAAAASAARCDTAVPQLDSDHCNGDEINVTSDDDVYDGKARPRARPKASGGGGRAAGAAMSARATSAARSSGATAASEVSVQKQEKAQGQPFFPFLWLHSPPQGAMPISPAGTTLVCSNCHTSLMQQWQSFQLADVPVLQRLYVVPLNQNSSSLHSHRTPPEGKSPESRTNSRPPREACFLCGQECGGEVKLVHAQAGVGKSRGAMYFPFICMLPCPPQAQALRDGRVRCCPKCHFILEEIWSVYRLSLDEELITSVSSFLVRYHAATAIEGSLAAHPQAAAAARPGSAASVCYCAEPLCVRPVDATGLVSACNLCYHDLHTQWAQHESKGSAPSASSTSGFPGPNPQPPCSPWARQYSCESFVCFFCRQEQRRSGRLCAVTVARLPVFLYAPRNKRMLLVDDGRKLVIGSCLECKAMVQVGEAMQQDRDRARPGAQEGDAKEPESASTPPRHKPQPHPPIRAL
ncbi:hypothetical protein D4764_02G0011820 [Takifugu flavidus]|uniref:Uncharacterized protein n=1 Tax=Takifugu flavidus TaxID=433684 RepID=A0A5C6NNA2_9TELE|nr:hypothetical protein D4764_02G0011820 [Takifugu flavidus]